MISTQAIDCGGRDSFLMRAVITPPPIGLKKTCLLASGIYSIRLKAGKGWSPGGPLPASVGASFLVQYHPGEGLVLSRAVTPLPPLKKNILFSLRNQYHPPKDWKRMISTQAIVCGSRGLLLEPVEARFWEGPYQG